MNRVEVINKNLDLSFLATFCVGTGVVRVDKEQIYLPKMPEVRGVLSITEDEVEDDFDAPPTNRHSFDVNKNGPEEIAKAFVENSASGPKVTDSEIRVVEGKPEILYSDYNRYAKEERRATKRSCEMLLRQGYGVTVWISPEDGCKELGKELAKKLDRQYPEGRLNIGYMVVENGEMKIKGKHIPLKISRFKAMEMADRLIIQGGKTVEVINRVDDLRDNPIGFKLGSPGTWLAECRKLMPELAYYWDIIENGDDIREQKRVEKDVREVSKLAKGDNKKFQLLMKERGHQIVFGDHGGGYLNGSEGRVRDYEVRIIDGKAYVEPQVNSSGELICPVCGVTVKSSDQVCKVCGVNLLQNRN